MHFVDWQSNCNLVIIKCNFLFVRMNSKLLSRSMFWCFLVIFFENFVWTTNLMILVIIIFHLFVITKCIWYLTYTNSLILMHHLLYFAFIWLGCLNWIVICCHLVRMYKWLYTLHKLCGLVRILFPWWMRGLRKKKVS